MNEPEELWLNNNVANMNRVPPRSICERDRQDAGDIIKLIKIRSIKDIINKLKEYGF